MTEEDFTGPCSASGRIVAADITDSLGGEPATNSTPAQPYRMNALSAFHPTQDAGLRRRPRASRAPRTTSRSRDRRSRLPVRPGVAPDRRVERPQPAPGGLLLRDGHDPRTNPSSPSWDVAWRGDLIYLFDMSRGVEILRLAGGPSASASMATVNEPARKADPLAAVPVSGLTPGLLVCPLFDIPARVDADQTGWRASPPPRPSSPRSWTCVRARCRFASWSTQTATAAGRPGHERPTGEMSS